MRTKHVADFTKDLADLVEAGFSKRKVWKTNFMNCLLNLFNLFWHLENTHVWPFMWSCALWVTAMPFQFLDAGEVVHFASLCGRGLLDRYRSRSCDKLCLHCQHGVVARAELAKFVWSALGRFFSFLFFSFLRSISWTLLFCTGTGKKVFKFLNPQQDVKRKEAWEAAKGMLKEPLRSRSLHLWSILIPWHWPFNTWLVLRLNAIEYFFFAGRTWLISPCLTPTVSCAIC